MATRDYWSGWGTTSLVRGAYTTSFNCIPRKEKVEYIEETYEIY